LLPETTIPFRIHRGRILPGYLDARDLPWLRMLMEEVDRFRSRPVRELRERLRQPLPCAIPFFKRRAAMATLLRLWKGEVNAAIEPEQTRETLFSAAATCDTRMQAIERAAALLGVAPSVLEGSLFADLPGEKLVRAPEVVPSPQDVALRINQHIIRSLLFHARRVRIKAEGAIRPVVRQAKLRGLLCTVGNEPEPILDLSGPFTVFRHTLLYGRALGELVQFLPHCARFKLRASCVVRGEEALLEVESGDPIFPAEEAKPFDSKLEERFARDLRKVAPDWDLIREPEPLAAGSTIIFPDFLLRHRLHPERRFFVEVMGFWSPDYVARKIAFLQKSNLDHLILCLDESRACGATPVQINARLVYFRRRIDPLAVIAAATSV
jgi:predicted nuclease of restriction endonuclease-like RecB superfamily